MNTALTIVKVHINPSLSVIDSKDAAPPLALSDVFIVIDISDIVMMDGSLSKTNHLATAETTTNKNLPYAVYISYAFCTHATMKQHSL